MTYYSRFFCDGLNADPPHHVIFKLLQGQQLDPTEDRCVGNAVIEEASQSAERYVRQRRRRVSNQMSTYCFNPCPTTCVLLFFVDSKLILVRSRSHKRSKSQLAKSLLLRDKPKNEDGIDEANFAGSDISGPPSPTLSGSTSPLHQGGFRSSRHKAKGSDLLNPSSAALSRDAANVPKPQDAGPTIEQSVRMFKLFEILRSGDNAAIAKAVSETSTMPSISEDERTGTSSGTLEGTTILHLAIQCADPPVVEQILAVEKSTPGASIDVNAKDRDGNTPLHLAAMLGRPTTVRLLLEQPETNESLVNYQGKSALDLARTPEIFQQLQLARSLFVDSKVKEIQKLVAKQDYDNLENLLEDSRVEMVMDVNSGELATDQSTVHTGGTLMHQAARNKDTKLIQVLLMHGADPFRRDRKGKLPQDVTKDDKTRAILKKSPAAAAAQRGIQEKAVLGSGGPQPADGTPGGKDAREMKGYLKKWTNYTSGYKLRWFVLEDGVLSYYKHQDDAGSACRGAINMRIAKLRMDPQDKSRFEIHGKSSVKYHLKANHVVEAKRWFWALNNAIQWTKDEAKDEERKKREKANMLHQAKSGKPLPIQPESTNSEGTKHGGKGLTPATAIGGPLTASSSRVSFQGSQLGDGSVGGDDDGSLYDAGDFSMIANDAGCSTKATTVAHIPGDLDDDEEFGDDASSHEMQPASKDAFNITAHSASLQLHLLSQVSAALQAESHKDEAVRMSDPTVVQALSTYASAVASLQSLVNDLLKISRDRDAYWQYRLDREADVRRLWEDSMAKVAKEHEELEGRIEESEEKRKRTKRALKDALEDPMGEPDVSQEEERSQQDQASNDFEQRRLLRRTSSAPRSAGRRKSTIADLTNLSDSDSDDDEEFFDAVGAGEVEVVEAMPQAAVISAPPSAEKEDDEPTKDLRGLKKAEIETSFNGYEDPIRKRLKMDADDRPKISLWVSTIS